MLLRDPSVHRALTRFYPWVGFLAGMAAGLLTGHPLAMVVYNIHGYVYGMAPLDLSGAVIHSFHLFMWPMILLYTLLGGLAGTLLGLIIQRFKENRLRLDTLQQEFELQVSTLRHHYKNLALGIHGFSSRIKRKLVHLAVQLKQCHQADCPTYPDLYQDLEALQNSITILEEAAQRLTHRLGQELLFLKALTSDSLHPESRDFYPLLIEAVQELLDLRFREKEVRVEINGHPLNECRDTLVFPFEPYTMEVILQNVIGNAMKYADYIQVRVGEGDNRVRVEVQDNGPGLEVDKLVKNILLPVDKRETESTHLGLRVSIHLLEKCGGRLLASSKPGEGAVFTIEVPKQPLPLRESI
ncbi:MAG: hypothetical protein A2Y80_00015 [Deltaproteobacteria bacterium RBG_13_58_19]|nr:MAG: hypothetical protein A2Y80_00015 [Deltaproteobacteria bacterium RBG_13_58_19]